MENCYYVQNEKNESFFGLKSAPLHFSRNIFINFSEIIPDYKSDYFGFLRQIRIILKMG